LRWHERLAAIRNSLLDRPSKRQDLEVGCLLELGLYQLIYMRIPAHASVHETVRAADALNKPWAKGVVNAVLRNFQRSAPAVLAAVDRRPEVRLSHPRWLLERLAQVYPAQWERICDAGNRHPPMTLRINAAAITREEYLRVLRAAGLAGLAHPAVDSAISLEQPVDIDSLPGFRTGVVSVQDAAAQMAAALLASRPGMRVLDACAAPGGKAAHILESVAGDIDLTLVEVDARRAQRLEATLARGGWRAQLHLADALHPTAWWDGKPFDRILLDAPCSGTGVIRRHPDIKVLRRPQDVAAARLRQLRLLDTLWPLLRPGGLLLYATCSILPEENEQLVASFVSEREAQLVDERRILPGDFDMDGFYYAALVRDH
jgi:16S rRNA (cytosine967-C5)-methyltransferase